jgi:hypothetical protein
MALDPHSAAFVARLRELNMSRYETLTPQAFYNPLADERDLRKETQGRECARYPPPLSGQIHGLLTMSVNFPTTAALEDIGMTLRTSLR